MTRPKKNSSVLEKIEQQTLGFQSIDPSLDFGDFVSVKHLIELAGELRNELKQYNKMLNTLDSAKEKIEALEKTMRETSERLVSGVASKYGKDSREYELAGAVKKSDRARKATITRLKSSADAKPTTTETA